jgi:hypothetical protein
MDFNKPVRLYLSDKVSKVTFRTRGPATDTSLALNEAKLTTTSAHGMAVGDVFMVDSVSTGSADLGGNINYDGRYIVKRVPTSTTIVYDNVGVSEVSTAVTAGIATRLDSLNINELVDVRRGPKTVTGYKLEQVNYNTASIEGYVDKRALRDGLDYTEPYLSARTIQMYIGIYGETLGDFWDQIDKLSKALAPNAIGFERDYGVRPLRFYQPTRTGFESYPSGIEMEIGVRPTSLVQYGVTRSMSTGLEVNGFAQRVSVNLLMPDPKKYHINKRTIGQTNRGSAPSFATIRGSGFAGDTKVTTSWYSGGKISTVTLIVGQGHWAIEMDRVTTTGEVRIYHQETKGDFMVYPGATSYVNSPTYSSTLYTSVAAAIGGASDPASVTVEFKEAWL